MQIETHAFRTVGSLPVPNVQELAAKANVTGDVPERYVRPELQSQVVTAIPDVDIPVIDIARLLDPQLFHDEAAKLEFACQEWGFFQLINHGVPNDVINEMKNDALEFFKLPLEEKKASAQPPNSLEGYGQSMVSSVNHKLDWADMLYLVTQPIHCRSMEIWPSKPSSLRDSFSKYSSELKKLCHFLLEVMAKNLGLPMELFLSKFHDQPQGIKINYYPPCPTPDKVLGIREHSDGSSAITIVLEVNGVEGLQIKLNDKWFAVKSLPGAFIVNIGDLLEILTNGKYRSIEHRVMVSNKEERVTIAAFHSTAHDAIVGPFPELVKDGKEKYKAMVYRDLVKNYYSSRREGKAFLENNKLISK